MASLVEKKPTLEELGLPSSLPTHLDLPDSDGTFVKNFQEHPQSILITESLLPVLQELHPDGQFVIGQDSGIYWRIDREEPLRGAVSPDWYYVPGVPPLLDGIHRRSYVLWQEHIHPHIILEFASGDGSEERDKTPETGKFWIYENVVTPGYYGIFQGFKGELEFYQRSGNKLVPLPPNERKHFPIPELGIEFGIWHGTFQNSRAPWLRVWDSEGNLLLTGDERALQEAQRAEQATRRAEQETQRAERLAEKLRKLGVNPDEI